MTKLRWDRPVKITYREEAPETIYLMVSYEQKDDVKKLGAKWDSKHKLWYTHSRHPNLSKMRDFMHKDDIELYL
jgi:hypothetical protein